jgi:hypothetical protein
VDPLLEVQLLIVTREPITLALKVVRVPYNPCTSYGLLLSGLLSHRGLCREAPVIHLIRRRPSRLRLHLPELVPALSEYLAICEGVAHVLLSDVLIDNTLALQRVLSLLEGQPFLFQVT